MERGQRVRFSTPLRPDEYRFGYYDCESKNSSEVVHISSKKGGAAGWWTDRKLVRAASDREWDAAALSQAQEMDECATSAAPLILTPAPPKKRRR
jgi:hypothetical protein